MVILGIDPGYAIIGYGALEYLRGKFRVLGYGAITTEAGESISRRLRRIYDGMNEILNKYKPDEIAVEELFFNHNHTTAIPVSEARGVILLASEQSGAKVFEYTPMQVKQSVVGYGRAEKKQVITMTCSILALSKPPKLDDTADALAIAVCHAHSGASRLRDYFNQN